MSEPSNSSISSDEGEGEWLDLENDEESLTFASLFDPKQTFPSIEAMLAHCKDKHSFDLVAEVRRLHLDFHGAIKLVNFIRARARDNKTPIVPAAGITAEDLADDEALLKPVLDNDAVLFTLDEVLEQAEAGADAPAVDAAALASRNKELEAALEALTNKFDSYRLIAEQTLDRRWGDDEDPKSAKAGSGEPKKTTHDYYFESYAHYDIHETMLKDRVRTDAYRDFIYDNKHLFQDKVVLDIGCGTGILSMFCAKAGAARVIAVDKSDIIVKAQENIFNNGLSDKITLLRGAIEDVVLPVDKVDVIVSEWMGYCLLYEAMLPSVLYARDKYLKPDGIMAPSSATLWVAPISDSEFVADHIAYWRDVYGFDMKAMQEGIYEDVRIQVVPKDTVCGEPFPFKVLDLRTCKTEDLSFTAQWKSRLTREVERIDGFLIWFDNFFDPSPTDPIPDAHTTTETWSKIKSGGGVGLPTGPFTTDTHWKQGLLLVPAEDPAPPLPEGTEVDAEITYAALQENERALTISGSWTVTGKEKRSCKWSLK